MNDAQRSRSTDGAQFMGDRLEMWALRLIREGFSRT
jgi:hypothetical protein